MKLLGVLFVAVGLQTSGCGASQRGHPAGLTTRARVPWLAEGAAQAVLEEAIARCPAWRERSDERACDLTSDDGGAGLALRERLMSAPFDQHWLSARRRGDTYELRVHHSSSSRMSRTDYYRLVPASCAYSRARVHEDDHYPVARVDFGGADRAEREALLQAMDAVRGDAARVDHARAYGLLGSMHQFSNGSYECTTAIGLCLGAPEPIGPPRAGRPVAMDLATVWAERFLVYGAQQTDEHRRPERWTTVHAAWSVAVYDREEDRHWWIPGGGQPVPDSPYERPMLLHVRRQLIDLERGIAVFFEFHDPDCEDYACGEEERAVLAPTELWHRVDESQWNLESDCDPI